MGVSDLIGRKALVTGGARGLGAGMAEALAQAGAAFVIGDIREDLGKATADTLRGSGATAGFVPLDVTDDASWEQAVPVVIDELGGLDIVVNNAGVEISGLVIDLDPADVRRMLDVNVLGISLGIKHAFRAMRPGGPAGQGGAVVNVSSVAATIAFPGIAGYSATKAAVDRLTRVAAMESGKLGYGVRVNCIYPGLVPTEMGNQLAQDVVTLGLFESIEHAVGSVVGLTPQGRLGEVAARTRRGRTPGSTPPSIRCTRPGRWAARTASSTATPTTSRPACCRPTRRTRCCSSRRTGWGSPPAARRSATASCWWCCAASAWSWSRT
jgi:NAD(P)-dependent dehydrogenase (short-subunit alcohol dehydrogenase family)